MEYISFLSTAYAADEAAAGSSWSSLTPLLLIMAVFYFLLIRPQQKKAREQQSFIKNIAKGDHVMTIGGIIGTVTAIKDDEVTIEIAENVKVKFKKSFISEQVINKGKDEKAKKTEKSVKGAKDSKKS